MKNTYQECWQLLKFGRDKHTLKYLINKYSFVRLQCRALSSCHGLRTPNEGINQRYLKNRAHVADKICLSNFGLELNSRPCSAVKAISSLGVRSPCLQAYMQQKQVFRAWKLSQANQKPEL